jgi:hypothetical protein
MGSTTDRLRATWLRPGGHDLHLRVSDADRTAVADLLARHYGAGRLDQAEFDERVTRAMTAKTGGDFQGLLDDLPDLPDAPSDTTGESAPSAPSGPPVSPGSCSAARRHRRRGPVLPGLLVLVFAVVAWHHLVYWGGSTLVWLVILGAVLMLVSRTVRRR